MYKWVQEPGVVARFTEGGRGGAWGVGANSFQPSV